MTETTYAGVLKTALSLIPVLNDPAQPHYEIQKTDSAATVAGKIYDAFMFGLSDEQFQMLERSAAASPVRAKEMALIKGWLDAAAEVLDEELDPADMAPYTERFAEFPSLADASDEEDVLCTSWALVKLADVEEPPAALADRIAALEPFIFPDFAEVMAELFPAEDKSSRRPRRGRTKTADTSSETVVPVVDELSMLAEGSELNEQELGELVEGFELGEGVDVPLSVALGPEAEAEAEAEAEVEVEVEVKAAPKKKTAAVAKKKPADKKVAVDTEKKPVKRGRTLKRTGGGGSGIMSDMRRLVVFNPEIPFTDVEHVMTTRNVDCKKSTWSPKLSDMRNMLNYLLDLGVVDRKKLDAYDSLASIAAVDEDLSAETAKQMDSALAELDK